MADTQDNNQQQYNNNFGDFGTGRNRAFDYDVHTIAEWIRSNPDFRGSARRAPEQSQSSYSDSKWSFDRESRNSSNRNRYRRRGDILEEFEDGIKDQLLDSLAGGDFKKGIQSALSQFTKEFGFEFQDIPREYGKRLTREVVDKVKNIKLGDDKTIGDALNNTINKFADNVFDNISNKFGSKYGDSFRNIFDSFKKGKGVQGSEGANGSANSFNIDDLKDIDFDNSPLNQSPAEMSPNEMKSAGGDFEPPAGETINPAEMSQGSIVSEGASEGASVVASGAGEAATGAEVASSGMAVAEGAEVGTLATSAGEAGAGVALAGEAGAGAAVAGEAGAGVAGAAVAGTGMTALAATGWGLLIIGIIITIVKVLGPALEGLAEVVKSVAKSWNRDEEIRKRRMENAQKRLENEMKWIAEKPFEILEEAARKWEDTWDSTLRTVGQTQGYDKESVYSLYESYAERLREEGLDSAVNATDIVDKLSTVLASGLSGQVAEEFAYIATKLGSAIPTQDFFGYADVYASIAANAISQGQSQAEALDYANAQLEQFASNLLYSSRELAGGFSTGLKNSSELFKDAVQIAQSARNFDAIGDISGTLTSVSAIIGSVAPDLASSLVSNVVQAAIGGNDSTIVALRSLAGINAGNTEFLQEMAENPQRIFSKLFNTLAELQNMSPANYMEVAEGLADVFGIDKAAFARVDFSYLAQAIDAMEVNYNSLNDNLALLQSGQTTTSAEQLKAQEINRVILDEGLAYVIDSEAGRMIQENMWAEQRANALMENEYAVDLQGSALKFLEGIRESFTTLLNFLNPVGYVAKGISNMTKTISEAIGNEQDIEEILKLTAVGENKEAFSNLTTRGKDLQLVDSYISMLGGRKGVAALNVLSNAAETFAGFGLSSSRFNKYNDTAGDDFGSMYGAYTKTWFSSGLNDVFYDAIDNTVGKLGKTVKNAIDDAMGNGSAVSRYDWGVVGKSFAQSLSSTSMNPIDLVSNVAGSVVSATQKSLEESNNRFQDFLNSLNTMSEGISYSDYQKSGSTLDYSEWANSVLSNDKKLINFDDLGNLAKNFGIADLSEALFNFNKSEDDLRAYFESQEARQGAIISEGRVKDEEHFRTENREFWDYTSGKNGVFETAVWLPFFGDGKKYDTRMDAVDTALSVIQSQIGDPVNHTVISGLEEISRKIGEDSEYTVISVLQSINSNIIDTFVQSNSKFQLCLADWIRYIAESSDYTSTVSKSSAWSDFKASEYDQQTEATLALANALQVFSAEELKKMDPQLQTNALLGEIVIILQAILQQTNTPGGLNLIDAISALGLGMTTTTGTTTTTTTTT